VLTAFIARAIIPPGYMIAVSASELPTFVLCPQAAPGSSPRQASTNLAHVEAAPRQIDKAESVLGSSHHEHADHGHGHSTEPPRQNALALQDHASPSSEPTDRHAPARHEHQNSADLPCPYASAGTLSAPPPILSAAEALEADTPIAWANEVSQLYPGLASPPARHTPSCLLFHNFFTFAQVSLVLVSRGE
jgi:hypothetical protein